MDVDAYLDRIGAARPPAATASALRDLHEAHLAAVPFENLSIHLGEPISLDEDALFDKIVKRRRGGFCYELNGAFAVVLEALGYAVTRLSARVLGGGRWGPPFDHLALLVSTPDGTGTWLADVGFGAHSRYPLRWDDRAEQVDPDGRFALVDTHDGDVEVVKDGEPQYRMELRPRTLADFEPTCWWQQTFPDSHFRRSTICTRVDGGGRVTISGRTLIRTRDGVRTEEPLASDEALLAAYREHFGIHLNDPTLL
jgi:N-hydroxyarylamine O-acetyltransferase